MLFPVFAPALAPASAGGGAEIGGRGGREVPDDVTLQLMTLETNMQKL